MADIPINLNLDKCLVPTYSNHPRLAEHASYDLILKAFVTPEHLVAAEKAKKALKKSTKPPPKKKAKKGEEQPVPDLPIPSDPIDDSEKRFLCEKAKSGISRCRKCGQTIDKGGLRFGYGSPDPRGEYGAIPIWFHIRCAPLDFIGFSNFDETLASLCVGFSQLEEDAQKEVFETAGKPLNNVRSVLDPDDAAEFEDDFDNLSERLVHRRGVSVPLLTKPTEITGANLLPFQLEGYSWMMAQEMNPSTRGGILADEMGMGKTLQTISLIVGRKDQVSPTLVVAPVAAVMQWYSEIEKFTGSNCLSIHVYHGSQKIAAAELAKFDIVLTTYQTLENDYRKEANKAKVKCKYCKKMFLPGKLQFHLKYMCGPNAMRTTQQSLRQIKDKSAAEKAKRTMGIDQSSSAPTIANTIKEIVKASGLVDPELVGSMTPYELNALYKQVGSRDVSKREPEEEEVKEDEEEMEEKIIVTEDELKKIAVADLKEELRQHQIDGWNRMKKAEIVKIILEKKLGISKSLLGKGGNRRQVPAKSTVRSTGRKKRDDSGSEALSESSSSDSSLSSSSESSRSESAKKRKPSKKSPSGSKQSVKPVVGRRSAAMKAIATFKETDSGEEESVDLEPRKQKVQSRKRKVEESEDSSSSEFSVSSDDSSDYSSSDYTDSESSGSTISVDSDETDYVDSDGDEEIRERSINSKLKSSIGTGKGVGKKKSGGRPLVNNRPKFNGEGDAEQDDEEALEDVDLNNSPLHCVKWGRLVLDEAHRIKQRTNSTSLAAFAIAADHRWCLSGTPLQNRVGELYSLVRFLRFAPFAHYFCKGCDCKSLHFRFVDNRFCSKCGCARTKHYSYFKQVISGPIIKFGIGDGSALNVLKTQVLDTILLRRTKLERQADLNLPSMTVEIKKTKLTPEEIDFYESIYKQSMLKFDTFAAQGTLLHNYAHIFDLLTRLRQAVDHPYLIVYGTDYTVPTAVTASRGICALCQDDIGKDEKRAVANCGHKFHSDCVKEYVRESPELATGGTGCPACFVPLTLLFDKEDDDEEEGGGNVVSGQTNTPEDEQERDLAGGSIPVNPKSILDRVGASSFKSSSKIEAVVAEILQMEPDAKCLIFSQFTRMLDLVDFRLKQNGIGCAKLNGSQTLAQRSNIILSFNSDASMRALLISLKAGGEGLNLQTANYVFLLDPWWNPASEMQAVQRAHRIGQTKPVKAIRFVTENTVEEKVIALQEMKQLVFEATIGQSQGAEKKLTESDLRFLFNH